MDIVVADLGGTHARFATASVAGGAVVGLGAAVVFKAADYADLASAWAAFLATTSAPSPQAAAIAVAAPVTGEAIQFTNNPWILRPDRLAAELQLDRLLLLNDFGAVAHAAAQADPADLVHLCGPDRMPFEGLTTICGPGTGLGVAQVLRTADGYHTVETEGGHVDFAPLDDFEDQLLISLRKRHGRVSVERVAAGPGLRAIYGALVASDAASVAVPDDKTVWSAAIAGTDAVALAALDRYCRILGSVAGDLALAQGANAVVIAGGLANSIAGRLRQAGFTERFAAKGRFRSKMQDIPVKLLTHPQPGLFGAAAAFAQSEAVR